MNLLPNKIKKENFKRRIEKIVVIAGMMILTTLVSLILVISLINFYISSETEEIKTEVESLESEYEEAGLGELEETALDYKFKIKSAKSFYREKKEIAPALKEALKIYSEGITLNAISLINKDDLRFEIDGKSKTRADLINMRDALGEDERIEEFELSHQGIIEREDIEFNINFKLKND